MPHELPVQMRSARAELCAVLVMLRNAHPPITLWVDCQMIIDGIVAGPRWCTSARRQNADLWRAVCAHLDDMGADAVTFRKVTAHQSKAMQLRHSADMQIGLAANHEADLGARRGATE